MRTGTRLRQRAACAALAAYALLILLAAGAVLSQAFAAGAPAASAAYRNLLMRQARLEWGLNAPIPAMAAQVHAESNWNPRAVSRVGARGMAQFMPATARWWCDKIGLAPAACQPENPAWALRALAGYDKWLFDRAAARFPHLGPYDAYWLALRGYNGGEAHVTAEAQRAAAAARAETAPGDGLGALLVQLLEPTRARIDTACGQAARAAVHCAENLGYPRRVLVTLQPLYADWGPVWGPGL